MTALGPPETRGAADRRVRILMDMGVVLWRRRSTMGTVEPDAAAETPPERVPTLPDEDRWECLEREVVGCTACDLHEHRTQTVFGVGSHEAPVMFVGEAPGAEEDRRGEPFVGPAGRLLDAMLEAIELSRETVYIANTVKCRPPGNRDPRPEETARCARFLRAQIQLIRPSLIVTVGLVAARNLLGGTASLGQMRQGSHRHPETGTPVIATYHPAYLLRSPQSKRAAWQDLLRVKRFLTEAKSVPASPSKSVSI